MQLNQNSKDSIDNPAKTGSSKMKISLFYKSYIVKASLLLIILTPIILAPAKAYAGFFSDIASMVLGTPATADETPAPNDNANVNNSQTIPLPEASINPDIKNIDQNTSIVQDGSFIYSDGLGIPDVKFEKSSISDQIVVYTVEKGDTLSDVADMFDVSVNTIRWENNISGQSISVGQKLNILPMTGVKHIVKSGDTISKIADKYDADAEDILIFNGISKGDGLKQGDIIFVPNGIIAPVIAKSTSSKPSSGSNKGTYSNTKAPSGYYLRPVSGIITSPYGSRKGGFHPGVDLAGIEGVTSVKAAADGIIVRVVNGCVAGNKSCGGRYGNHIDIQHSNGTMTRYAHLYRTSVSVGQSVSQGDSIGILGNTGGSTGPHLHFEIRNSSGSTMKPPVY